MLHLDLDTAIRLVDEAIAEKGEDFIYHDENGWSAGEGSANCKYVHHSNGTPTPGCLVGHVLIKLGIDPMSFERIEGEDAHGAISRFEKVKLLTAHRVAGEYLMYLQGKQDIGNTWGESRDYAREMLSLNGNES